ncbi:MAG: hypothetical protein K9N46_00075 [Candidatus Marinimicrobia bacterium]|nr:hypothetical protein [Candidatus Neomarinimicrobiota bacterium]MCF7829922.1 hypothetical protein [Candidatus Neomarinimicrobiota bacterium]MCF7879115.1 hypothetical protein [Candidatus Neomarinimicrobiota bacterium]
MEWDFRPEAVVTGEIEYTIVDYRNDLWEEVRPYTDASGFETIFWVLYHLAIGYTTQQMAEDIQQQNQLSDEERREQKEEFDNLGEIYEDDIAMLKAIVQRKVLDYSEEGRDVFAEDSLSDHLQWWINDVVESHDVEEA